MQFSAEDLFGKNGYLSKQIDNFEIRKGQIKMAEDIINFFNNDQENVFMGEGEVGIGKSMAYLLTSLFNNNIRRPIIVSTSSITLQNQLVNKDLKDVSEIYKDLTGSSLSYTSFKGRSNYVCMKKYFEVMYNKSSRDYNTEDFQKITKLVGSRTYDGRKPGQIDNSLWNMITAGSYECPGSDCGNFFECYYYKIKKNINLGKYDVVVVNHSLAVADYHIRTVTHDSVSILPDSFDLLILDEAHHFEEYALGFFTKSLSKKVFDSLERKLRKTLNDDLNIDKGDDLLIKQAFENALSVYETIPIERLINKIESLARKYDDVLIEEEVDLGTYDWIDSFSSMLDKLTIKSSVSPPGEVKIMMRRIKDIITRLKWLESNEESVAIRGEVSKYGAKIKLSKINIASILTDFWDPDKKYVLTSATLSFNKKFDYLAGRLGIDSSDSEFVSGIYESSFDYKKQAKLMVPSGFCPKNKNFDEQLFEGIKGIVSSSPYEKTLLLFTSYRQMNELKPKIENEFGDEYEILSQSNNFSKEYLLDKFRESGKAILLGQAASFGTGVDIKGNKNIILAKLNFDRPNDPLFKAQSNLLESQGKNPFMDLSIPNVSIRTKQQVGRSIRSLDDNALIVIFDDRLVKSRWGKLITRSLPVEVK